MRRDRAVLAVSAIVLAAWLPRGFAADAKSLMRAAYEKTKTAKSLEDFESIISMCEEAQKGQLDEAQGSYVKSLMSWAVNRRGEAYTEQASQLQQQGDRQQAAQIDAKALADFELAIRLDEARWKPWHNRGVSNAIAGKYQEAVADFSKVIELNPKYSNAWFNRGEIYFDLGEFEQALQDYSEAIRLNAKDSGAFTSRAHTHFRLRMFTEALADYSKAVELAPDATTLANRGEAYQSLGQWKEAAEDLRLALQHDNESPRVLQSAAWLMATCPETSYRDPAMAVQAAEKALELVSQPDALYLDTLAAAYANAGTFDKALAKAKEALSVAPAADAQLIQKRIELYQQKRPYRQPGGETAASPGPNAAPAKPGTRQAAAKS